VHRAFIARRLSPGGCADLLAATLFMDALDAHS
jgi:triphosphoribosyl-dephospho-CoA synthase